MLPVKYEHQQFDLKNIKYFCGNLKHAATTTVTAQSGRDGSIARTSIWNPIIQPTTILRIALLIIQNAALNNPTAGFLQMVLNTELALTRFSNVFASLAAGVVQDYS